MVTHLYGILGVILDRTFGNIIRMLRVIRLPKEERGHLSWTFVGTLAVILAYGLIMMFSASYSSGYTNHGGNIYYFIKPQAIVAAVGFVVMLGVSLINYRALRYMFWTFYVITLALLVTITAATAGSTCRAACLCSPRSWPSLPSFWARRIFWTITSGRSKACSSVFSSPPAC